MESDIDALERKESNNIAMQPKRALESYIDALERKESNNIAMQQKRALENEIDTLKKKGIRCAPPPWTVSFIIMKSKNE